MPHVGTGKDKGDGGVGAECRGKMKGMPDLERLLAR